MDIRFLYKSTTIKNICGTFVQYLQSTYSLVIRLSESIICRGIF